MTLVPSHDPLTDAGLAAVLGRHPFVAQIICRAQLESTNDTAKQLAGQGAPEGLLVITDEQTAGRGRFGRRWWAPVGSALLTSLLFRPADPCKRPTATGAGGVNIVQQLMMLCALSAADAVIQLTALPVELKWPNDLLVRGRKLAGLLAESVFQGDHLESVVVGMGLNVNVTFADAPSISATATSLQLELGHPVQRLPLLVAYVTGVAQRYAQLKNGLNPYEEWSGRLATLGRPVTAHLSDKTVSDTSAQIEPHPRYLHGVAQGVDVDGALLLRTPDGAVHRLVAADISLQGEMPGPVAQIGANPCEGSGQQSSQTSI